MPRVGLVTDSTCDLPPSEFVALDVVMVPLTVHIGDEHFRDWIDLSPDEFYRRLEASPALPTTSQPSPAAFTEAYDTLVSQGVEEIVTITLSAALSGTYESATLAAKSCAVPVRVVDGKLASHGTTLIVKAAVEARAQGLGGAAVEERALEISRATQLFFLLDTLDYLVKGGRAGKATGLAASLLNIKPVLRINDDGIIEPFRKVRGRQQAVEALAQHVADESRTRGRLRLCLLHAHLIDEARELEEALLATGADFEMESRGVIGSVIGTYTGPGAVGLTYYPIG